MTVDPQPRYLFSGAKRHIARPDHPLGVIPTDVAFCGANANLTSARKIPGPTCKRCSLGWVAYLDRLARERDEAVEDDAFAALRDDEERDDGEHEG